MRSRYTTEKFSHKIFPPIFLILFKINFCCTVHLFASLVDLDTSYTHEHRSNIFRSLFHRTAYVLARQSADTHTRHAGLTLNRIPGSSLFSLAILNVTRSFRWFVAVVFSLNLLSLHALHSVFLPVRVRARYRKLWNWISFASSVLKHHNCNRNSH